MIGRPKTRTDARRAIVQTANRFRIRQAHRRTPYVAPRLYTGRHVQQAVAVCRRNQLVTDLTLRLAGYRTKERR